MSLKNQSELTVTREKLRLLEERFQEKQQATAVDAHVKELSMRSLKRVINQLKEEIARYESHLAAADGK